MATLVSFSFVIYIFLMQFINKDNNDARLAPIFSIYSKFNVIIIFGLVNIGMMGMTLVLLNVSNLIKPGALSSIIICNFILFLINIGSITYLFGKAFEFIREEKRLAFISNLLDRSVHQEISAELTSRIRSKYLRDFCKKLNIDFTFFYLDKKDLEAVYLGKPSKGQRIVSDIHLGLLKRSAELIELNQDENLVRIRAVWHILPGTIINSEKIKIASVPKSAVDYQIKFALNESMKLIPFKSIDASSFANLLSLSKDELIKAIRNGRTITIRMLLSQYESCIGTFLSAMDKYAVNHLLETTMGSKDSIDWGILRQMEIDFYDALEEALKSKNIDIIIDFVYYPFSIAWLALGSKNSTIFKRFITYYPNIYSRTSQLIEDIGMRNLINESIVSRLDGLMDSIMVDLEKESQEIQEIKPYDVFARNIAAIFYQLLKRTMENNDLDNFKLYGESLNNLMDWLGTVPSEEIENLESRLHLEGDSTQRQDLEEKILISRELDHIYKRFNLNRRLIWLGIGGWLAHLTEANRASLNYHTWANIIDSAFSDLEILYVTYNDDSDLNNEVATEWGHWISLENIDQSRGNHRVNIIQGGLWSIEYYCQRGLELSPDRVEDLPSVMPIGTSKHILDSVIKTVQEFKESESWIKILNETITDIDKRLETFIEFHKRMLFEEDRVQEDSIIGSELNTELIREFKSRIVGSWEKKSTLRSLIKAIDKYEECPNAQSIDGIQSIKLTYQVFKGAFVNHEQKKIFYHDPGENYGSYLAYEENEYLIDSFSKLPNIEINSGQVPQAVNLHLNDLRKKGYNPCILYDRVAFYRAIHRSPYYKPSHQDGLNRSSDSFDNDGSYDDAVLINIRGICYNIIIIVDLERYAKLVQYPYKIGGDFPLDISINLINESEADRIIEIELQKSADAQAKEPVNVEQLRRILQQRLILEIYERCQFEDIDANSGILIRLKCSEDRISHQ
jgi:hypothetical protein